MNDVRTYTGRAYRVLDPEHLSIDWTPLENGLKNVRAQEYGVRGDLTIIKSTRSWALFGVPADDWRAAR